MILYLYYSAVYIYVIVVTGVNSKYKLTKAGLRAKKTTRQTSTHNPEKRQDPGVYLNVVDEAVEGRTRK